MSELSIVTRAGVVPAQLDDSDISNAIWLSLPLDLTSNMLGGMIYCECPLDVILPKEGRVTELEEGDIAYWPGPGALCFFFGPTPLSGEDGTPVAPYPVIRIGRMSGDFRSMEGAGDRQRIRLLPPYRSRTRSRVPYPGVLGDLRTGGAQVAEGEMRQVGVARHPQERPDPLVERVEAVSHPPGSRLMVEARLAARNCGSAGATSAEATAGASGCSAVDPPPPSMSLNADFGELQRRHLQSSGRSSNGTPSYSSSWISPQTEQRY